MAGGYFVAETAALSDMSAAEVLRRLPEDRVLDHAGIPSPAELSRLVAILRGQHDGDGPSVLSHASAGDAVRLTDQAVLALQGADGDPEMEWEDAVALWQDSLHGQESSIVDRDEDDLLAVIDELRFLVGEITPDGERALYYQVG